MIFYESGIYSFVKCPICERYLHIRFKNDNNTVYFCFNCVVEIIFKNENK
ncbi:hypothetical protein LCGC14_1188840 [marine sediment metagenome]|uniref:Uncharacterized protein n=1 Tax=marine sediment metagenome TaxID=412755 RepID=A0A0F9P2T0_9ZZZZ